MIKPCIERSVPKSVIDPNIKRTEWRKLGKLWVAATYERYLIPYDPQLHFHKCSCGLGILLDNFPMQYETIPKVIRYVCRKCGEQFMVVSPKEHFLDDPNKLLTLEEYNNQFTSQNSYEEE